MADRTYQQPYMVRYQDADGDTLTGFTVRGETELAEAFAEMAHRPEITLTWRRWAGLNNQGNEDANPWRGKDDLPPAVTSDEEN